MSVIAPLVSRLIMQHMKSSSWCICVHTFSRELQSKALLVLGSQCSEHSLITWPWVYQNNQTGRQPQSAHWKLDNINYEDLIYLPLSRSMLTDVSIYPGRFYRIQITRTTCCFIPQDPKKQRRSIEIQITDSKQVIFRKQTTSTTKNTDYLSWLSSCPSFLPPSVHKPTLHAGCL